MNRRKHTSVVLVVIAIVAVLGWESWRRLRDGAARSVVASSAEAAENRTAGFPLASVITPTQPGRPDFSGVWKLDYPASDSFDAMLKASGRSAVTRALASQLEQIEIVQHITQTEECLSIDIKSLVINRKEELFFDGRPTLVSGLEGDTVEAASHWNEDGKSLVTEAWPVRDGKSAHLRISRSFGDDRDTIYVLIELEPSEGEKLQVRRVYRRIVNADAAD